MHVLHQAGIYIGIVTGFIVFIVGIALLVLPGPGWITIMVGLTMLAGHFLWARRLLAEIRRDIQRSGSWVEKQVTGKKMRKASGGN